MVGVKKGFSRSRRRNLKLHLNATILASPFTLSLISCEDLSCILTGKLLKLRGETLCAFLNFFRANDDIN